MSTSEKQGQDMLDRDQIPRHFERAFGAAPRVFSAPGRVNFIGEYTDFNEGFVLPLGIDRRTYVAAAPRPDRTLRVCAHDLGETRQVRLGDGARSRTGSWMDYVAGTACALEGAGLQLSGADVLIASDVPRGAGLASSAALEVAVGFALASLAGDAEPDRLALALAGQRAEHEWVGTRCGLMDQYIAAFARPGHAILLDCRTLVGTAVPLELGEARVVVLDTQVRHDLATSAYNERRTQCEAGVRAIASDHEGVKALRDVSLSLLRDYTSRLEPVVARRCHHVVSENARTLEMVEALRNGDMAKAGLLLSASHESLRRDFEVSCEELDFLVERVGEHPGVYGSRMIGGGFGGCVLCLVQASEVEGMIERVSQEYARRFARTAQAFVVQPSAGAREE
jgi:galactokinase